MFPGIASPLKDCEKKQHARMGMISEVPPASEIPYRDTRVCRSTPTSSLRERRGCTVAPDHPGLSPRERFTMISSCSPIHGSSCPDFATTEKDHDIEHSIIIQQDPTLLLRDMSVIMIEVVIFPTLTVILYWWLKNVANTGLIGRMQPTYRTYWADHSPRLSSVHLLSGTCPDLLTDVVIGQHTNGIINHSRH